MPSIIQLANKGKWCALIALAFLAGCRGISSSTKGHPEAVFISKAEAESIAEKEARKRGETNFQVEAGHIWFDERSYWRVVVECESDRPGEHLAEEYNAEILSKESAERLTYELAKNELAGRRFEVEAAKFIRGPHWFVTIRRLPARPGSDFTLVISARNGSITTTLGGM
jgi:hypothetical protein